MNEQLTEQKGNNRSIFWCVIIFCLICACIGAVCTIGYNILYTERTIAQGAIIDTETYTFSNSLSTFYYLNLTFDNGETYTVSINEDDYYDFTMHSEVILYLSRGALCDTWSIDKMIKVPSEGEN